MTLSAKIGSWLRRYLCRKLGHDMRPTIGAPWWSFNYTTVYLRCVRCGHEAPQ